MPCVSNSRAAINVWHMTSIAGIVVHDACTLIGQQICFSAMTDLSEYLALGLFLYSVCNCGRIWFLMPFIHYLWVFSAHFVLTDGFSKSRTALAVCGQHWDLLVVTFLLANPKHLTEMVRCHHIYSIMALSARSR